MKFRASIYYNAAFDMGKAGTPIIIEGRRYSQYLDGWKPGVPLKPSIINEMHVIAPSERQAVEAVFVALNRDDRPNGQTEPSLSVGDVVVVHTTDADVPFAIRPYGLEAVDMFEADAAIVRH